MPTLLSRREKLTQDFAHLFVKKKILCVNPGYLLKEIMISIYEMQTNIKNRTDRFRNSALPNLVRVLNKHFINQNSK